MHYSARNVYLVLDPGKAGSATVVVHDSAPDGRTQEIQVDADRLYTLREGTRAANATIRIEVPEGASAYAFTFG
jgi:hypothetical protein